MRIDESEFRNNDATGDETSSGDVATVGGSTAVKVYCTAGANTSSAEFAVSDDADVTGSGDCLAC